MSGELGLPPISGPADPREPLHQLNGRLIRALMALIPECDWSEWIVNVIMLHRNVRAVETVTLETSATWYLGSEYFTRNDCGPDKKVRNLDGQVPLNDSLAGACIRAASMVWVDDLAASRQGRAQQPHPLQEKYRSFAYVGVETERPATSEYVFPIRLRVGSSDALLGVLNCEWYGSGESAFQRLTQAVISHRVLSLVDVHARFIPVALDQIEAPAGEWESFLDHYYDRSISRHVARIREGVPS